MASYVNGLARMDSFRHQLNAGMSGFVNGLARIAIVERQRDGSKRLTCLQMHIKMSP